MKYSQKLTKSCLKIIFILQALGLLSLTGHFFSRGFAWSKWFALFSALLFVASLIVTLINLSKYFALAVTPNKIKYQISKKRLFFLSFVFILNLILTTIYFGRIMNTPSELTVSFENKYKANISKIIFSDSKDNHYFINDIKPGETKQIKFSPSEGESHFLIPDFSIKPFLLSKTKTKKTKINIQFGVKIENFHLSKAKSEETTIKIKVKPSNDLAIMSPPYLNKSDLLFEY